jgi:hypothetical protein
MSIPGDSSAMVVVDFDKGNVDSKDVTVFPCSTRSML